MGQGLGAVMADDATTVGRRVIYQGRVQGVGFRWTTRQIAKGFHVTGFVRNLPDGTVEVHVQGTAAEVSSFLNSLRDTMASNIDHVEATEESVRDDIAGFTVRH